MLKQKQWKVYSSILYEKLIFISTQKIRHKNIHDYGNNKNNYKIFLVQ